MSIPALTVAIETSGPLGSVAVMDGATLLAERVLGESGRRHARTLVAELDEMLRGVGIRPRDVPLVSVSIGPGSFTGLRVGVVAAKTWAFVTGARLAGIETFHAVVESLPVEACSAWVIDDALRGEIFVQEFQASAGRWCAVAPVAIRPLGDWLHGVAPGDIVCGPGAGKWLAEIAATGAAVAEAAFQRPTAAGIAHCGLRLAADGRLADPFSLVPLYVRRSAAEEKLDLMMEGKRS